MSSDQSPDRGEGQRRVEPEIILRCDDRSPRGPVGMWMRIDERDGVHRVYIARPGLSAIIIGLLLLGLIGAVMLLVLAGVVLLWIPLLIGGIFLALLSGSIRYRWRRLQAWWARPR